MVRLGFVQQDRTSFEQGIDMNPANHGAIISR
jgi:hypothetical protein